MVVRQLVVVVPLAMRDRHPPRLEIDPLDLTGKESHVAEQLPDRVDDVCQIEVARRDLVKHRGEEEEVVAIDERDSHARVAADEPVELSRGCDTGESATEDDNTSHGCSGAWV